jgi:hypothetical protein
MEIMMRKYEELTRKEQIFVKHFLTDNGCLAEDAESLLCDNFSCQCIEDLRNAFPEMNKHERAGILGSLVKEGIIWIEDDRGYDHFERKNLPDLFWVNNYFLETLPQNKPFKDFEIKEENVENEVKTMNEKAKSFNELSEKFDSATKRSEKADLKKQAIEIFMEFANETFKDRVLAMKDIFEECEKIELKYLAFNEGIYRYLVDRKDLRLKTKRAYQFIFNQEKRDQYVKDHQKPERKRVKKEKPHKTTEEKLPTELLESYEIHKKLETTNTNMELNSQEEQVLNFLLDELDDYQKDFSTTTFDDIADTCGIDKGELTVTIENLLMNEWIMTISEEIGDEIVEFFLLTEKGWSRK